MKRFSDNHYLDAAIKTGIIVLTFHLVVMVIWLSLDWTVFLLETHLQNIYLVLSAVVVLYLFVLFVVKKTG